MRTCTTWAIVCLALGGTSRSEAAPTYSIVRLGLSDLEHTRQDGSNLSKALWLNEAGKVVGTSQRFNGGNLDLGSSVWFYNGTSTINVGLTDAEHTRNDGYKSSTPVAFDQLNEAGWVAGFSERFNGGSLHLGRSAWLYDGTTKINLGLTGAEHTRSDGFKSSIVGALNEAGQAVGSFQSLQRQHRLGPKHMAL